MSIHPIYKYPDNIFYGTSLVQGDPSIQYTAASFLGETEDGIELYTLITRVHDGAYQILAPFKNYSIALYHDLYCKQRSSLSMSTKWHL